MELVFYETNTSEYYYFDRCLSFLNLCNLYVRAVLMDVINSSHFPSLISKVIWRNELKCVTATETEGIFVSKWFIYRLSLNFVNACRVERFNL